MNRLISAVWMCSMALFVNAQNIGDITKTDCFLSDCRFTEDYPNVDFGYITVPEDYTKPNGRLLKVAFAVIKATSAKPKSDAIIEFQGGWGMPSLERKLEAFTKRFPLKDRDLIMYDYRGSGYSEPKLCDWLGVEGWRDLTTDLTSKEFDERQAKRYNNCLDSLEMRKIDYNQYGTNNKAKDAVILAEALGYKSYNLWGISYGTRAIQNFIRAADSSNITIRSAILDSNVAIGNNNHSMTQVYVDVLQSIFEDCKSNPKCNKAYPDLESRYVDFLRTLEDVPFKATMLDGNTFTFNAEEVNAVLHQMLYFQKNHKDIPIFIEHLINRDRDAFAHLFPYFKTLVRDGYNALGAINYVYDWSMLKEEAKQKFEDAKSNYKDYVVLDGYKEFYLTENRIKADSMENVAITSDIPALFLAGSYDPITPPDWTKMVAKGFPNHFYYEAKKFGHGISPSKCGAELMLSFLDNPSEKPDTSCYDNFGNNDIAFRTSYYKNNKISALANQLTSSVNIILIVGLVFVILISIINIIAFFISLFKKQKDKRHGFFLVSLLTLFVLFGLYYFIDISAAENTILILFGLVKGANMVMLLTPIVIVLGLIAIFRSIKLKKYSLINVLSSIAVITFIFVIISYRLFPNF